jgi:hypothetical protein
MGMAASQARFLGLTARKTNTEYEGQQINQQRTALGNQTANYYNQMLGMKVPVPPAVDNFTKTVYTFEDGSLKNTITSLIARQNGLYTVSYLRQWTDDFAVVSAAPSIVVRNGTMDQAAIDNAITGLTRINQAVGFNTTTGVAVAVAADAEAEIAELQQRLDAEMASILADPNTTMAERVAAQNSAKTVMDTAKAVPAAKTIMDAVVNSQPAVTTTAQDEYDALFSNTPGSEGRLHLANAQIQADPSKTEAEKRAAQAAFETARTAAQDELATGTATPTTIRTEATADTVGANAVCNVANALTRIADPTATPTPIPAGPLETNIRTNGAPNFMIGAWQLRTLGSMPTQAQILADPYLSSLCPDGIVQTGDKISKLIEQEIAQIAQLNMIQGESALGWVVRYVQNTNTGAYEPQFYNLDVLNSPNTIYDSQTSQSQSHIPAFKVGSQDKTEEIKGVQARLEQDATGRIINITLNADQTDAVTYALTTNTIADQMAYDDAMNQYEYDKYQYDQKIQDINAKIAIIQAEDRNLELRLKQLDTEQNAIQTEMDAVSKVIEKNVESTFKTFG